MRPLFLITNDDGIFAKGLRTLVMAVRDLGDIVVMAPSRNASGSAHSFTASRPIRVESIDSAAFLPGQEFLASDKGARGGADSLDIYACDGTPVDCVKVCMQYFCPRIPTLVLSGINHGSNSSINILYSGTMAAVLEASMSGLPAIGFSLLDHSPNADFSSSIPFIHSIVKTALDKGLPHGLSLNVNIPVPQDGVIKGVRVCRQAEARWLDSYERRIDPKGMPYFWIAGRFECLDKTDDTDQWALENGYISIVPTTFDFTAHNYISNIRTLFSSADSGSPFVL